MQHDIRNGSVDEKLDYLLDLEEIRSLIYRYCQFNDGGWPAQPLSHQGPSATLFTEDGVWDGRPLAGLAKGRDEIAALVSSYATQPMAYHVVTNPLIEVSGDAAKAQWHFLGARADKTAAGGMGIGGYEMEYARTAEGWRISLLRIIWGRKTELPGGWQQQIAEPQQP